MLDLIKFAVLFLWFFWVSCGCFKIPILSLVWPTMANSFRIFTPLSWNLNTICSSSSALWPADKIVDVLGNIRGRIVSICTIWIGTGCSWKNSFLSENVPCLNKNYKEKRNNIYSERVWYRGSCINCQWVTSFPIVRIGDSHSILTYYVSYVSFIYKYESKSFHLSLQEDWWSDCSVNHPVMVLCWCATIFCRLAAAWFPLLCSSLLWQSVNLPHRR